jgi:hypothetical protein
MTILKFSLPGERDRDAVEADVALALFAAECVFGRPRVRLEASYVVADGGSACVLKASGEAGEAAARIFAGLTAARVGEEGYRVRHEDDSA